MKDTSFSGRRIIRAEQFDIVHTYLNYRSILQNRWETVVKRGNEQEPASASSKGIPGELIDDVQFEEVREADPLSPDQRKHLSGYGFTAMDPCKEVNNFSYRVIRTSTCTPKGATNRYYTPLELRYGTAYTRNNIRPTKGHWLDSQVY